LKTIENLKKKSNQISIIIESYNLLIFFNFSIIQYVNMIIHSDIRICYIFISYNTFIMLLNVIHLFFFIIFGDLSFEYKNSILSHNRYS